MFRLSLNIESVKAMELIVHGQIGTGSESAVP